jgi:hypothetical protein
LEDLDRRAGELVVCGKGGRQEWLPLLVDVGEAIVDWLRDGRPDCQSRVGRPEVEVMGPARRPGDGCAWGRITATLASGAATATLPYTGQRPLKRLTAAPLIVGGAAQREVEMHAAEHRHVAAHRVVEADFAGDLDLHGTQRHLLLAGEHLHELDAPRGDGAQDQLPGG